MEDEYVCSLCFTNFPMSKIIKCPNGHIVCHECIVNQIKEGIKNQEAKGKCHCCHSQYLVSDLDNIVPKELMEKFDEHEAFLAVNIYVSKIPGLKKCYACNYVGFCDDESCPMVCPKCGQKTCVKCMEKYHPNRTCEEAHIHPMRFVEKDMSESIIRICPHCHIQIVKDKGCNHMTCTKCKTEFCYLCGQNITGHVSEHFNKNQCQQSIDDKQYTEKQIEDARKNGIKKYEITV